VAVAAFGAWGAEWALMANRANSLVSLFLNRGLAIETTIAHLGPAKHLLKTSVS